MLSRKALTRIGATAVAVGAALTLTPGQAQAAYTPQGVCGSDYYVQRSHGLSGARVYLLYNGSYNCVVAIKTSSVGTPTRITAGLQVEGQGWALDTGLYRYYAGPVKARAAGKCVRFFGYHGGENYTSPWGNCG
ncbi:serine/threonine protein kinase [Micromonospora sp. HM5-17]|uniref:serine/threonine protein kinase n=1 Tax=Micromonospora sp. HM5-17 TaxID=2487710 RepID=UPI000F47061E|nr:serine/threonine protein kinase [Micromonospora sp. HM5-17]ROT31280.1 serine/threonine protein kinase [Micromonospora sp. HM5-17]